VVRSEDWRGKSGMEELLAYFEEFIEVPYHLIEV